MAEEDYSTIRLNGQQFGAVYFQGEQIWPKGYSAILTVAWVFGSNYTMTTVPAAGGYATATWTLTVRRGARQVYQNTVTPTSVTLSDSSNFSYTSATGRFTANDRGTNGYSSSTSSPSSAQMNAAARSCNLVAKYVGTITADGQTIEIDATADTVTMTQNANAGRYISSYNTFDQFDAWLNDYYDSAHEAPAWYAQTKANASCRCGNYIKWDSNASAYYYQTLGNAFFVFSSTASWITVDGRDIAADSRGKTTGSQRTATIKAQINPSIYSSVSGYATATFYQEANSSSTIPATCSALQITAFKVNNVSVDKIRDCKQTTVTIALKATWREAGTVYTAYGDGHGDTSAITQGTLHTNDTGITLSSNLDVTGADGTTKTSFTVTNIHTLTEKTWTVTATYLDKEISPTINQVADSYSTSYVTTNSVSMSVTGGSITAAGGSLSLSYSASHYVTTITKWNSDQAQRSSEDGQSTDDTSRASVSMSTAGPTGHEGRFSRSGTTVTHTSMTNKKGTDKVTVTITHPDDSTKTASTSEYSATNDKSFGTLTFTAGDILATENFVAFSASCPITWTSGYHNADEDLKTSDFTFSLVGTPYNNAYRTYSLSSGNGLQVTSLAKYTRSANSNTTRVKALYQETGYADVTKTIYLTERKNEKGGGGTSTTPGTKTYGTPYTGYDYAGSSVTASLSSYGSASSPAPFDGATYVGILSASATGHKERTVSPWTRNDIVTYTWDSLATDVETVPETGEDYGSWSNVSDTPTVIVESAAQSWLSVSGSSVTTQNNSGSARSGIITARIQRGDTGNYISDTVTFYQSKYCSISASVSQINLPAQGGNNVKFMVYYTNTQFDITFSSPVTAVTPTGRKGSASSSGSVEFTVTWETTSSSSPTLGDITISPVESALADIEIGVEQEGRIEGTLNGIANCVWRNNYTIDYEWVVKNTGNTSKSVYLTMYFGYTNSEYDDPNYGGQIQNETSSSIDTKTIPGASGGTPGSNSGTGTKIISRVSGKTYWARVTGTGVTTWWYQIEDSD